jgi:hypothetical protein
MSPGQRQATSNPRRNTMKDLIKENPATDEFAPIELGSVSEETKGIFQVENESDDGAPNSREL